MTITDKMLHFSISFLTFSTGFLYAHLLDLSLLYCYVTAFVGTVVLGVVKEITDLKWDWKDFAADSCGIVASAILITILMLI
ncbi:MAG: hypothetical protein M0R37_13045 [Bacteroidales bacterium]|nr:hypothetical protein [Bacteroidales bacterium]